MTPQNENTMPKMQLRAVRSMKEKALALSEDGTGAEGGQAQARAITNAR